MEDNKSQSSEAMSLNSEDQSAFIQEQQSKYLQNPLKDDNVETTYVELSEKIHKEFQLIYIAAYSQVYRQKLEEIALQYNCDLQFIRNSYIVSCKDGSKAKIYNECKDIIKTEIDKINYVKIDQKDKKFKIYNSPQVNRVANERRLYICQFNDEIYLHTNFFTLKELQEEKKKLILYSNIFSVCFLRKKNLQNIDIQISNFYKIVLSQNYKARFQESKMVVQITRNQRSIYILGQDGATSKSMMQAKHTIKNLIQGLAIAVFKNMGLKTKEEEVKLTQYLKKVSPSFPITWGKIAENVIVVISKDNILRDLFKKYEKFSKKVKIQSTTEIGIYLPQCSSKDEKKKQINKFCKLMGYDLCSMWGIRYFRPMIAPDSQTNIQEQTFQLIVKIMAGFNDVKDKHEIMKTKKPQLKIDALKKKQLEEQNKYAYILKNQTKDSTEISKALRRDVMEDIVFMKKRYNVIYSILEGKQFGPFYIDKVQYDKGIQKGQIKLIDQTQMKKGQYFQTYLKISESIDNEPNLQELQDMLIEELKKLKQIAKQEKPQSKSYQSERKIAHMIKRMIVVF